MNSYIEKWQTELERLSPKERVQLAYFLLSSVDPVVIETEDAEIEDAWELEISRRVEEIRSGRAVGIPYEEFMADLRRRYP